MQAKKGFSSVEFVSLNRHQMLVTLMTQWFAHCYLVINPIQASRDRPIYRFADIFCRYRYIGIGKLDIGIGLSVSVIG